MNLKQIIQKIRILLFLFIMTFTIGCLIIDDDSSTSSTNGLSSVRTFYATNLINNSIYQVKASLVYNGTYCAVYIDDADSELDKNTAITVGKEFDINIYEKIVAAFGEPSDVDGNGKIILLALDIRDGGSAGSYCAGYFDPVNYYDNIYTDTKYSNECDMIYLDTDPGATSSAYLTSFKQTMAHEFQHLICFNAKASDPNATSVFDTWIDEGFSSAAEKIYEGAQVTDKINYFNSDDSQDLAKGQRFIAWDTGGYDVLGNYSTVYLFFQWLSIQASNGDGIYKEIMNSSYSDYRAVWGAESRLTGFSGTSFSELLRDWNIANLLCKSSGLYGYEGEITTTVHYFNSSADNSSYTSTRSMLPGECIYLKAANPSLTDTTNIDAAGVDTLTSAIDSTGTSYSGDVLLAYNTVSTVSTTKSATGTLPVQVASIVRTKSLKKSPLLTKKLPVDAVLKFKGPLPLK